MPQKNKTEQQIFRELQKSPLLFIKMMFNLRPLKDGETFEKGKHITNHQLELLTAIEKAIRGEDKKRISVRAGHGVGKSCTLAWVIIWYLFCFKDAQVPCTAPTSDQMHDVLWKEVAKWLQRLPDGIKEKYVWSTGYIRIAESPETWFARAKTARKEAPEALAGIHADHVMMIVDEASGVDDVIYETAEGALTEDNILVLLISNPTRTSGYFYDTHHRDKDNWQTLHFNSNDSPLVNESYNDRIIEKYGDEGSEYRVRVLGEFPDVEGMDAKGYVPLLKESDLTESSGHGFVGTLKLGVDPSGEGKDVTAWVLRDKFHAAIIAEEQKSTPKSVAQRTLTLMTQFNIEPFNVFVDNFGQGANVAQELAMIGKRVQAVNVGEGAMDNVRYINKRAEIYWRVREWIRAGASLEKHDGWEELLQIRYAQNLSGKLKIMSKDEMRRQGVKSPNYADALSLTFWNADVEQKVINDPYINEYGTAYVNNWD